MKAGAIVYIVNYNDIGEPYLEGRAKVISQNGNHVWVKFNDLSDAVMRREHMIFNSDLEAYLAIQDIEDRR